MSIRSDLSRAGRSHWRIAGAYFADNCKRSSRGCVEKQTKLDGGSRGGQTFNPTRTLVPTRANSHRSKLRGASHSVYVSRPKEVALVIEEAAAHVH